MTLSITIIEFKQCRRLVVIVLLLLLLLKKNPYRLSPLIPLQEFIHTVVVKFQFLRYSALPAKINNFVITFSVARLTTPVNSPRLYLKATEWLGEWIGPPSISCHAKYSTKQIGSEDNYEDGVAVNHSFSEEFRGTWVRGGDSPGSAVLLSYRNNAVTPPCRGQIETDDKRS